MSTETSLFLEAHADNRTTDRIYRRKVEVVAPMKKRSWDT